MPKYYCDYCDIFLTHDTAAVRKAHNRGWKHIVQVEQYYSELKPEAYQDIVDTVLRPRGEAKEGDTFTPSFTPYGSGPPAPYGRDSGSGYSPYQGSQRQNHYDDRNGRGNDRNGGDRRPYGRDSRAPIRGDRRPYGNDSRPPPNDGDRRPYGHGSRPPSGGGRHSFAPPPPPSSGSGYPRDDQHQRSYGNDSRGPPPPPPYGYQPSVGNGGDRR